MKTSLLVLVFIDASLVLAHPQRANGVGSAITCETVRAYVSQVGLVAAKALAGPTG